MMRYRKVDTCAQLGQRVRWVLGGVPTGRLGLLCEILSLGISDCNSSVG